jgi:hypothetical protein
MPSLRVHCAVSRERTGFNFKELHEWIDDPCKDLGINHRTERHSYNKKEENKICNYWDKEKGDGWGKKAVVEWLFHIAVDNLETAFKMARKAYRGDHAYNFFKFGMIPDSKFIFFDFDHLNEKELRAIFKDIYEMEN